jgi:predicted Zn-dependent protease with MMP-like domain
MTDEEFEKIIKEALAELPEEFRSQMDNVEIVIEDWPLDKNGNPYGGLLGLYHGVPKTMRNNYSLLPDKITIYKQPLLRISHSFDEAKKHIKQTVLHELGHHFGLSDEELQKIEHH